jgi:hypothetical protein
MKDIKLNIEEFVKSYLATAAWITCDSDENDEFTVEAKSTAKRDCIEFISQVTMVFGMDKSRELLTVGGQDLHYLAAHDFFLTRNGHGTGFWDKPEHYGEDNIDQLTVICAGMGEVDCYHMDGDDSLLTF